MVQPSRSVLGITVAAACATVTGTVICAVALVIGAKIDPLLGLQGTLLVLGLVGGLGALGSAIFVGLPISWVLDRLGLTKRRHFIAAGAWASLPALLVLAVAEPAYAMDLASGWAIACPISGMFGGYAYWTCIYGLATKDRPSKPLSLDDKNSAA